MFSRFRFEDDGGLSELDEEVVFPQSARVIRANIIGILSN